MLTCKLIRPLSDQDVPAVQTSITFKKLNRFASGVFHDLPS